MLFGGGLEGQRIFLGSPTLAGADITAWIDPTVEASSDDRIAIRMPGVAGAPPAGTPPPRIYRVGVGTGAFRPNSTVLSVGGGIPTVANPPLLAPLGRPHTAPRPSFPRPHALVPPPV